MRHVTLAPQAREGRDSCHAGDVAVGSNREDCLVSQGLRQPKRFAELCAFQYIGETLLFDGYLLV